MQRPFLNLYNNELHHLRQMGAEFAREFPKIAGRLALDQEAKEICPDPFVERLLEGFAFLAARLHLKLDAEFPRFTQALLETVYPHYLSPTPSMAVVRFEASLAGIQPETGFLIPRGSSLRSVAGHDERTACEYRTAHDVRLWPVKLIDAHYHTRDLAQLELPRSAGGKAAFRIRLQSSSGTPLKQLGFDRLGFYLRGADEAPGSIYEQIFAHGSAVIAQAVTGDRQKPRTVLSSSAIQRAGLSEEEALLPPGPRGFSGYRLLREYFALPQRFLFFEIAGLQKALKTCEGDQIDLIIVLKEQEVRLEDRVDASSFEMFCTPAINLFPKRADPISLSDRFSEHHVVADKTRPLDFEIFQIEAVTGQGARPEDRQEFRPFYLARDADIDTGAFYTTHRIQRVLSEKERKFGKISSYTGTEVYLSLVDTKKAPYRSDLQQLEVKALCTNRHLPIQMASGIGGSDFTLDVFAPVTSIRCLTGPTSPQPPQAEGERAWRIISHLSLNYLSLLDMPEGGAVALRDLLKLYADASNLQTRKQIEGLLSAKTLPIVRRVQAPGPIAFARGLEISLTFDETAFEGTGIFLLGSVIEQFFRRYVSINSFTETVIQSQQRGEIIRWKPQIGGRHLI